MGYDDTSDFIQGTFSSGSNNNGSSSSNSMYVQVI